ncbi:unnamed protein product, partial [Nesidiocoris tenuis]
MTKKGLRADGANTSEKTKQKKQFYQPGDLARNEEITTCGLSNYTSYEAEIPPLRNRESQREGLNYFLTDSEKDGKAITSGEKSLILFLP